MLAFILGDFLAQGFGDSFDLLGVNRHTRELRQQLTPLLEADQSPTVPVSRVSAGDSEVFSTSSY